MTRMRFSIYMDPYGRVSGMNESGAVLGNGVSMTDFNRDFDGSELVYEFDVPPLAHELDGTPLPEFDQDNCITLSRMVYDAALHVALESSSRYTDLLEAMRSAVAAIESNPDASRESIMKRFTALIPPLDEYEMGDAYDEEEDE